MNENQTPPSEEYRTREQEEAQSSEPTVSFQDVMRSLAGAVILTDTIYKTFSPEEARARLQQKWVKSITQDMRRNPKFKEVFASKQRRESRQEYTARRAQQAAIEGAIQEMMATHRDTIFEGDSYTAAIARQTLHRYIQEEHPELESIKTELTAEMANAQAKHAAEFKAQNDKNNARFNNQGGWYKRSEEDLLEIQAQEKAEHQAEKATNRDLNQQLIPLNVQLQSIQESALPKAAKQKQLAEVEQQMSDLRAESVVTQKAVSTIFAQHPVDSLTQEQFVNLLESEINKTITDRRGKRKHEYRQINVDRIAKRASYYKTYFHQLPTPEVPKPFIRQAKAKPRFFQNRSKPSDSITINSNSANNWLFSWRPNWRGQWPRFDLSRFNWQFPRFDLSGFKSIFGGSEFSLSSSIGNSLSTVGRLLGRLPGLGGFFGGGAAVGVGTGTGAAVGGAAVGVTAGAAGAGAGAAAVAPIIIVVAVVLVLIIGGFLLVNQFSSPVTEPYAVSQIASPAPEPPTASTATNTTPTPPYKTAGENLEEVMNLAAQSSCTPLAMIKAISRREAGSTWNYTENQFTFYNSYPWWTREQGPDGAAIIQSNICQGFGYNTCTNEIASDSQFAGVYCGSGPVSGLCRNNAEVMGPMQFEKGTWGGYKSRVESKLQEQGVNREADRRVVLDAFIAAGLKLSQDAGAASCTNWTAEEIGKAAGRYYGQCTYSIGKGGNYCAEVCGYYNQYSSNPADCSIFNI